MSETSVEPAGNNLPTTAADMGLDTGLEDFDTTDMVMPRLTISHEDAVFVDSLTGEEFPQLRAVVLGLIKQRILWAAEVDQGDHPLCKSYNFDEGHPNEEKFPWKESGFDKAAAQGEVLPCGSCKLKDWGTHPQRDTPWCSEQHTLPILMEVNGDFSAPAILTVQRSAIKSSKTYLTSFARSRTPVYTVVTELSLDPQKKGSVKYAVPRFKKVGETEQDDWAEFAGHYRSIREFISTPPPEKDDDNAEPASAPTSDPGTSATAAAAPTDDDLPF